MTTFTIHGAFTTTSSRGLRHDILPMRLYHKAKKLGVATNIEQRAVHLAFVVAKDAQVSNFISQGLDLNLAEVVC